MKQTRPSTTDQCTTSRSNHCTWLANLQSFYIYFFRYQHEPREVVFVEKIARRFILSRNKSSERHTMNGHAYKPNVHFNSSELFPEHNVCVCVYARNYGHWSAA